MVTFNQVEVVVIVEPFNGWVIVIWGGVVSFTLPIPLAETCIAKPNTKIMLNILVNNILMLPPMSIKKESFLKVSILFSIL